MKCVLQVVGVGKKLLVLQWRHSAAWTAWCPASDTDTVEGFQFIRVSADGLGGQWRRGKVKIVSRNCNTLSASLGKVLLGVCLSIPEGLFSPCCHETSWIFAVLFNQIYFVLFIWFLKSLHVFSGNSSGWDPHYYHSGWLTYCVFSWWAHWQ